MRFLKKELWYPDDDNDEVEQKRVDAATAYLEYLEERKEQFPKKFFHEFFKTRYFHDYAVKSIKIDGDAWCYWKKSDVVTIEIRFDQMEYTIVFDKISYLKLLNEQRETCWHNNGESYSSSPTNGMEEIVLSEIYVLDDKNFSFEFLTCSGAIFEIHFQSVKINKRKIYY